MHEQLVNLWQICSPYRNEINFIIFIPLFFLIRSLLLKKVRKILMANFEDNRIYPFVLSLVNWGTFYAIFLYAVVYFKDTLWLGKTWFHIGNTPVNTLTFVVPLIIISLAVKSSNFISEFFLTKIYDRHNLEQGVRYTFNRLFHYGIVVLSVLVALPTIGLDFGILTVFAGVLGIGVGFGIQNIVSNFISGLIILFERPIKVGDRIKLMDLHCDVEHIKIRSTIVRTRNNEHIIIPNSQFIENQVINWSYGDLKIRQQILIGVAYGSNVRLVEKLLLQAAGENENVLSEPGPRVDFLNFGESSLDLRLLYWIPHPVIRTRVKSALNFRIYELLDENNIKIPFPQRDINLRSMDADLLKNIQIEYDHRLSENKVHEGS